MWAYKTIVDFNVNAFMKVINEHNVQYILVYVYYNNEYDFCLFYNVSTRRFNDRSMRTGCKDLMLMLIVC